MAIPTRTDGAPVRPRTLGRRPIVLARLPHVGAGNIQVDEELTDVQEPEFLESGHDVLAGHFVDPGHQQFETESAEVEFEQATLPVDAPEEKPTRTRKRRRKKRISHSKNSSSTTKFEKQSASSEPSALLFSLHTQLAPYAGAIVALALIASAGLLYWMIVSPNRVSLDMPEEIQVGFDASSAELPKFVPELPSFASRTEKVTEEPKFDLSKWNTDQPVVEQSTTTVEEPSASIEKKPELVVSLDRPVDTPTTEKPVAEAKPAKEEKLAVEEPTAEIVAEQVSSPVEGLNFVQTSNTAALDFTKLGVSAGVQTQADTSEASPAAEVAGRSVSEPNQQTTR